MAIEFSDRIQVNPQLLRLKNTNTDEIIDWEIQDLDDDEISQKGTEITADTLNSLIGDTGWIDAELKDDVTATTTGYGGACGIQYRKIGNHVYVRGSISTTYSGSSITLATLPYAPKYRPYRLVALTGTRVARIYVNTSKNLMLEWVKNISDGSNYTDTASWIAVDIDFFID